MFIPDVLYVDCHDLLCAYLTVSCADLLFDHVAHTERAFRFKACEFVNMSVR